MLTSEGAKLLTFFPGSGKKDVLYSSGVLFHFGSGVCDFESESLGNELFTLPGYLVDVSTISSEDGTAVADISKIRCDLAAAIEQNQITEIAVSLNGQFIALDNVRNTSGDLLTISKNPAGDNYIEWSIFRKRSNTSKTLFQSESVHIEMNPFISELMENRFIFDVLNKCSVRRNNNTSPEFVTPQISYNIDRVSQDQYVIHLAVSLLPSSSIAGAYKYNTIKQLNIGVSDLLDNGLFTVIWSDTLTKQTDESFVVRFSVDINVRGLL